MHSENYPPLTGAHYPFTVAVVTDTHVPDRSQQLPVELVKVLQDMAPDCIFHAGDISLLEVLTRLESISPLLAVRGNRDFILNKSLPMQRRFSIGGVKIALTHGQGSLWRYIKDKIQYVNHGYDFERYRLYFAHDFPDADLVVFGHTHAPVDVTVGKRHYLNSGATYPCKSNDFKPRVGRIVFMGDGSFQTGFIEY